MTRLASLGLLAAAGCSWATMTRPPAPPVEPAPPVACTTSRAAPVLDTVGTIVLGVPGLVTTVYGIAAPVCRSGWCMMQPTSDGSKAAILGVGLALVGLATVEAFSAAAGYSWAAGCEELREWQLACVSGVESSCARLRQVPRREGGKASGSTCTDDLECRDDDTCFRGHCQPRTP